MGVKYVEEIIAISTQSNLELYMTDGEPYFTDEGTYDCTMDKNATFECTGQIIQQIEDTGTMTLDITYNGYFRTGSIASTAYTMLITFDYTGLDVVDTCTLIINAKGTKKSDSTEFLASEATQSLQRAVSGIPDHIGAK